MHSTLRIDYCRYILAAPVFSNYCKSLPKCFAKLPDLFQYTVSNSNNSFYSSDVCPVFV
jgi:hypothetical protein